MIIKNQFFFLYADRINLGQIKKMENSDALILKNLSMLTKSSEKKFKQGNFKGALEDKMKANEILNSKVSDEKIIEKYKKDLSSLYSSKFDLIFDHKQKIDFTKRNKIVKILKEKSQEKLKILDYKGAIKALRRAEKYILN